MKQTFLTVLAVLLTVSVIYFWYDKTNAKDEIAYIELNTVIEKYQGMIDARSEFEAKSKTMRANVDTLVAEWEAELKAYEKERKSMSKKEIELKQELLRNKQQQINGYSEATEKKIQEEEQLSSQNVLNEINEFVMDFGKKSGYGFVIGANGTGNLLYANEDYNLTDAILEGLNKEYNRGKGIKVETD